MRQRAMVIQNKKRNMFYTLGSEVDVLARATLGAGASTNPFSARKPWFIVPDLFLRIPRRLSVGYSHFSERR